MADNLEPTGEVENSSPETQVAQAAPATAAETGFSWKTKLTPDVQNSPTLQKFEDTPEGLGKAVESHLSLERLLGHEKVPVPKSPDDVEGWTRFNKAMGVPDKPEGYSLADVQLPGNLKDLSFNKQQFAEVIHKYHISPTQAKGLWDDYVKMNMDVYGKALQANQDNLNQVVNQLRSEWGDAYESNVELGQLVISKFAGDKETEDYLTSTLTKDPRAIKFLAKIGNQFAENKVGEFGYTRFSLTPSDAKAEWEKIAADPQHPYNNEKAPFAERDEAIKYVNKLIEISIKAKQG